MLQQIERVVEPTARTREQVLASVRAQKKLLELDFATFLAQCKTDKVRKLRWKFVIDQQKELCNDLQSVNDSSLSWEVACSMCKISVGDRKYTCLECAIVLCDCCEGEHDHDMVRAKKKRRVEQKERSVAIGGIVDSKFETPAWIAWTAYTHTYALRSRARTLSLSLSLSSIE